MGPAASTAQEGGQLGCVCVFEMKNSPRTVVESSLTQASFFSLYFKGEDERQKERRDIRASCHHPGLTQGLSCTDRTTSRPLGLLFLDMKWGPGEGPTPQAAAGAD